ncbi:unnamed protein product [Zymoseptoria tritici ST99CH_1A5]|uniref:Carboxypeptidase n=1 Tax=Zymoseptoria tritici ST99CH_1A5 TaxID=1276529 RepID=A0A1Y6LI64_ZYMTR|nr:unnamed protein product [Zymoseptoria tritici ST99CH_1A5]
MRSYNQFKLVETDRWQAFYVEQSALPDVTFNFGESYAGYLSGGNGSQMFFWYFPTTNPAGKNDTVIWTNGGPGCSSLGGLMQENGPISWRPGQASPVANPWSWHKLANVVWVDYPIGTGYSHGSITAQDDSDLAQQFLAFWDSFTTTFEMYNHRLFISSESYGGVHVPYISATMIAQGDNTRFNVQGGLMYSPVMPFVKELGLDLATIPTFARYWQPVLNIPSDGRVNVEEMSMACGLDLYFREHLAFPPPAQPWESINRSCPIFEEFFSNAINANNCLNVYHVPDICPVQFNVLGDPALPSPEGFVPWPSRPDVRQALHATLQNATRWHLCQPHVFDTVNGTAHYNTSDHAARMRMLIEHTNNVIIASGTADAAVFPNGTAIAIQHLTWNGAQGFQEHPGEAFVVPKHKRGGDVTTWAGGGEVGFFQKERGLMYMQLLAGHQLPQYAPTAAFRHLEYLLGRVEGVGDAGNWSIDMGR